MAHERPTPFHLAFPVTSLDKGPRLLRRPAGLPRKADRPTAGSTSTCRDLIVAHLAPDEAGHRQTGKVDGDDVPVRHFGLVLDMGEWQGLADRLVAAGTKFVIEPHVRFKGQVGEQATMFLLDPCGNARWSSRPSPTRRSSSPNSRPRSAGRGVQPAARSVNRAARRQQLGGGRGGQRRQRQAHSTGR